MSATAIKLTALLSKNHRIQKLILGLLMLVVMVTALVSITISHSKGSNSQMADIAIREYEYWQIHTPTSVGYSCQGDKYCKHFNVGVVDWCCYFAGYCADEAGLDLNEIGFLANTNWSRNLKELGCYEDPDTYLPRRGNLVFFDYSGRAHHDATGYTQHVGVVADVSTDGQTITVIAGNESGGANWASTSVINKYEMSSKDNRIACYGAIGADVVIKETGLNVLVREIICHNETGVLYSECDTQYATVVPCDVNALSIGVYGWHGGRALSLLQSAYAKNPTAVSAICRSYGSAGTAVRNALVSGANWSNYVPNQQATQCIKAILLSQYGKQAQDELALNDAQGYIDKCKSNGLTDAKAIAYCCDILNQWGSNSFSSGGCLHGVTGNMTLAQIYNSRRAWSDSNYNYYNRRTWTYNYIKDCTIR